MAKQTKKPTTNKGSKSKKEATTPKKETTATTEKSTQKDLELNKVQSYKFKSNGKGPGMAKDKIFVVSGAVAQILFNKGYGNVE